MATYRYTAYSIQESLKQVFDNADVLLPQIVFWIQVVANNLRYRDYEASESSTYLSVFSSVPILYDSKGRPYFDLPGTIMDFDFDKGIQYITYNYDTGCCCTGPNWAQVQFEPTKPIIARRLYWDEYEKPTSKAPYFYRVAEKVDNATVDRVYLLGTECIKVSDVEVGLLLALDPAGVCDLDDQIPVSDEMISIIIQEVLQLGRWVTMMPTERVNDGTDDSKGATNNVPKISQDQQEQPE